MPKHDACRQPSKRAANKRNCVRVAFRVFSFFFYLFIFFYYYCCYYCFFYSFSFLFLFFDFFERRANKASDRSVVCEKCCSRRVYIDTAAQRQLISIFRAIRCTTPDNFKARRTKSPFFFSTQFQNFWKTHNVPLAALVLADFGCIWLMTVLMIIASLEFRLLQIDSAEVYWCFFSGGQTSGGFF